MSVTDTRPPRPKAEVSTSGELSDGVIIRPLHWTDLAQVTRIEQAVFPDDAWSAASWWHELAARPMREYWVAEAGAAVLGYAGLTSDAEVADVMTVAVAPEARGRGLGRELVARLIRSARARGVARMMLEVRADNRAAVRLYEGFGFRQVHRRRGYYPQAGGGPALDALVMARTDGTGEEPMSDG